MSNNWGGVRPNSGRKSKSDEQQLTEKLSPLEPLASKALEDGLKNGQAWAVKLFYEYKYGKPLQRVDQVTREQISISPKEWV